MIYDNTQIISITELYLVCDGKTQYGAKSPCAATRISKCRGMESKAVWIYIYSWDISLKQFVCESTKRQEWLLVDHDEQVAVQPYPRHVLWATYLANVKFKEAVIPVVFLRILAQYSTHVTKHFSTEVQCVELLEEGAVP